METQVAQDKSNQHGYSSVIGRAIDNTALATYMTCPKKFEYAMLMHRRGEGLPSPALAYGTAWHKALEVHYKLGGGPADRERNRDAVRTRVTLLGVESDRVDDYRTLDRLLLEYDKYVARWGMPLQEDAQTVGWPEQPLVEIATEVTWPGARHPYAGKIDRIVKAQGLFFVEDHKTTSRWSSNYFRQFELKNQMIGYAFIGQLLTGIPISGVRINAHVCRKSDSQFERQTISFSQDRLEEWARNYNAWITRIENDVLVQPTLGDMAFIRNFDACDGKYAMCSYAGVCSSSPQIRHKVLEQDFAEIPWNPLEAEDDGD